MTESVPDSTKYHELTPEEARARVAKAAASLAQLGINSITPKAAITWLETAGLTEGPFILVERVQQMAIDQHNLIGGASPEVSQ